MIVSAVEHPAVLESARWLGRLGYDVTELEGSYYAWEDAGMPTE